MEPTIRRVLSLFLVSWALGVPAALAQAPSVVHAFDGVFAGNPAAGLTLGADGFLYGTTEAPASEGAVFRVRPNGTGFQILHAFALPTGVWPSHGALARGAAGVFYGTTLRGGAGNRGTVYRLETGPFGATVTTLHEFAGADANPDGGVILASDGLLYGAFGDDATWATVYRLATDGTGFQHLRELPNGLRPTGTLIEGSDGLLYGTTERGGPNRGGTVFRLSRTGADYSTLVELEGNPVAGLTEAPGSDGTPHLFGVETTGQNQATQFGAIFQMRRDGAAFLRLSGFTASDLDGDTPRSPLLLGRDGALYGTATSENLGCPPAHCGTVFRVTPAGRPFSLFTFPRLVGGAPMGALVQGPDGTLYGTARVGGPDATAPGTGHGVVFSVPVPDRVPLDLTGPTISDEGGEAAYTLTLRNTTNHTLAGPITVAVTPTPGLVFTNQSVDGWSCTPYAVGLLCVWPTELPAGVDSDAHTMRFTLAPPFSMNCGSGPSPCVSVLATVYDYGAAASAPTVVRALVGGTLNTPPVPQNDTAPVYGTATAVIRVLDNDTDPDGDALRVTRLLEFPRFGDATINADGTITYTPADTLLQSDTLRYEVSDGRVPTAATASAVVTLIPSVPPLTVSKTRLDLGPLAPRRIATGRYSLRSPVAMEARIELQPVTAAEIAAALQGTAYDPAQAVSDPEAFRADSGVTFDPLYPYVYTMGVHYQAPSTVGRVSVARVQIIGEPPGLAPVTRSLLIVAASADPATAPSRAVDDTTATPVQTEVWYDVLANDGGVSTTGRPLYLSSVGCMSAFPDTDCRVPANMSAYMTGPPSTGPQELGIGTSSTVTGTATGMYAVSELDACFDAPQTGDCQLEGNMYYGYLSVDVGGTPPDLSLIISPASLTVAPGETVTLTATVTNQGPGMASRVTVSGFADLTRLSGLVVTPSQGSCATPAPGGALTCTLRNLLQGASATITLQGTAQASLIPAGQTFTTLDGSASVSFGNADSQPGNNAAQAQLTIASAERSADVSVTLTATPPVVDEMQPVRIVATIYNAFSGDANNVTFSGLDALVNTHIIDSVTTSQGTCEPVEPGSPLRCTLGTLPIGSAATIDIVARPTSSVFQGTSQLSADVAMNALVGADEPDPSPTNNSASVVFQVRRLVADLSLTASLSDTHVTEGGTATATLRVLNGGPETASGTVRVALPAASEVIGAAPGYDPATQIWTFGPVPSGVAATLALTVRFDTLGNAAVGGEILTASLPDPDSTPGNGSAAAEDDAAEATLVVVARRPNLRAFKFALNEVGQQVSTITTMEGARVVFWVGAVNEVTGGAGVGPTTGAVTLTDTLPAGLVFVSTASDPRCSAVGRVVTCVDGTVVPANGTVQFFVATSVQTGIAPGDTVNLYNAAVVSTPDDVVPDDNTSYAVTITVTRPAEADLAVGVSSSAAAVVVGQSVTVTAVVTNRGPQAATGVSLTGFQELTLFQSLAMSTTQGRCPTLFALGQPVRCTLGTVAPGASVTVTFSATAGPQLFAGATGASVRITFGGTLAANEFDPQPGDNSAAGELAVSWPADVAPSNGRFTTAASPGPVDLAVVGDTLNYRVTVSNVGGPTSGPVTVRTTLAGMVPLNLPSWCTAPAPFVVSCTIVALAPGASTDIGFWLAIGPGAVSGSLPTPMPATTTVSTPGESRTTNNTTQTILTIVNRPNLRVRSASFTDPSHRPIAMARVGDTVLFTVVIENVGQVDSPGVDVAMSMLGGRVTSGGFCPGGRPAGPTTSVCHTPGIGPGQSTTIDVAFEIQPWALPTRQTSEQVTASARILDLSADAGQAAITVIARLQPPDLRVARASFTTPAGTPVVTAVVGDVVLFTVEVRNVGDLQSAPLRFDASMFGGIVASGGTCGAPGAFAAVNCYVPAIAPGQSRLVSVAFRIQAYAVPGNRISVPLTATADVRERGLAPPPGAETNFSNNTGSARLIVSSR